MTARLINILEIGKGFIIEDSIHHSFIVLSKSRSSIHAFFCHETGTPISGGL